MEHGIARSEATKKGAKGEEGGEGIGCVELVVGAPEGVETDGFPVAKQGTLTSSALIKRGGAPST